jgi:hypothetical protein
VFAPTDEAFNKLEAATLNALLADKEKLTSILTYHVVSGEREYCVSLLRHPNLHMCLQEGVWTREKGTQKQYKQKKKSQETKEKKHLCYPSSSSPSLPTPPSGRVPAADVLKLTSAKTVQGGDVAVAVSSTGVKVGRGYRHA